MGERYSKYRSTVSDGELHFFIAFISVRLAHILESVLVSQLLTQLVLTQHAQT